MNGQTLSIRAVGALFGLTLPEPGRKCKCPFRKHVGRKDPTFRVYMNTRGDGNTMLYKCWSCDPPDNTGDSVALYARLAGCDRNDAWKKLKDQGFAVPGGEKAGRSRSNGGDPERQAYEKEAKRAGYDVPPKGVQPKAVLPLDIDEWNVWRALRTGALDRFAVARKLPVEFLRAQGMIDLPKGRCVGFTYFDPRSGVPCRVKVRTVEEKRFWMLPKPNESKPDAKALAPLYLAHLLKSDGGPVTIVEGEIDALTLAYVGIPNVVSLPDGSESAKTVDLSPILSGFTLRLVATDGDRAGSAAHNMLRARSYGQVNSRVEWERMVIRNGDEDIESFKDANDALKEGFTREQFLACLRISATEVGYELGWDKEPKR